MAWAVGGGAKVTLGVFHQGTDAEVWKVVFDEHECVRRGRGQLEGRVFRSLDDPNRVVVHNDFAGPDSVRSATADPSLATAMEPAGVTDGPWLGVIERVVQKRYAEGSASGTLTVPRRVRDYGHVYVRGGP